MRRAISAALFLLGVSALTATGAAAASSSFIQVSPRSVEAGTHVTVHGVIRGGCALGDNVTVYSRAFAGITEEEFAGVPALTTVLADNRMFSIEVKISKQVGPGSYTVGGRCGGGNFGQTRLRVTNAAFSVRPGIAFVRGTARSEPSVWVASANGRRARRLARGAQPLLAPNGQSVAFVRSAARGRRPLIVRATRGRRVRRFFGGPRHTQATPLAWSPDSRYLAVAVANQRGGRNVLIVIDLFRGRSETVARGLTQGASFSPTVPGRLVFGSSRSTSPSAPVDLYAARVFSHEGVEQLTHDGRSLNPVWGRQGIVFDRERLRGNEAPEYQLVLLQGGEATQITSLHPSALLSGLVPLAVSADGRRLVASYVGEDTSQAWSVDLVSHEARRLTQGRSAVTAWGISADGESALVEIGGFLGPPSRGRIATLPFGGGRARVLIRRGGSPSWNR